MTSDTLSLSLSGGLVSILKIAGATKEICIICEAQNTLRAVRLIYYTREGMLEGASSWQMLNQVKSPGFGILSQQAPDKRYLMFWLYYYFNRHVGEWVNPILGSAPYQSGPSKIQDGLAPVASGPLTPVLATSSTDGKTLYLVIANGSWDRSVRLRAQLRGFAPGRVEAVVLSQPDLDSPPLLEKKDDGVHPLEVLLSDGALTASLPPHSVSFITVTAAAHGVPRAKGASIKQSTHN
ncbi:MAG: hypothetical protein P4L46_01510 [Fimbriimonas sp.]|nr:hypothetical protein [Fimbriimonas sp.]